MFERKEINEFKFITKCLIIYEVKYDILYADKNICQDKILNKKTYY